METRAIRNAVLKVRASKGMLEDAARYLNPAMEGTKRADQVRIALRAQYGDVADSLAVPETPGSDSDTSVAAERLVSNTADTELVSQSTAASAVTVDSGIAPDYDRHSCGSFFMNPILTAEQAARLPEDAPRFDAALPDGTPGVKTSAAWLIDHAGFHKGFKTAEDAKAGLSTMHTLALTNRGGAQASDVADLARAVQDGVEAAFGVRLVPEPVVVGMDLR